MRPDLPASRPPLDNFLGARGKPDIAGHGAIAATDDELDRAADFVQLDAEVAEHFGGNPFPLANETQQEVLGPDVIVVKALSFLLRKLEDFARSLGEFVEAISHVRKYPVPRWEPAAMSRATQAPLSITLDANRFGLSA